MQKRTLNILIAVGAVIVIILIFIGMFIGTYNGAVYKEENVSLSMGNISKEEQRRVDLFNNLVDAVKSAKAFEQDTLIELTKARGQAVGGNIEEAKLTLNAVVEAYPEVKTTDLYKQAMTEFSVTENRLAGYREQYNNSVRDYRSSVRGFPTSMVLAITGYQIQDFKPLDYQVDNSKATDLNWGE